MKSMCTYIGAAACTSICVNVINKTFVCPVIVWFALQRPVGCLKCENAKVMNCKSGYLSFRSWCGVSEVDDKGSRVDVAQELFILRVYFAHSLTCLNILHILILLSYIGPVISVGACETTQIITRWCCRFGTNISQMCVNLFSRHYRFTIVAQCLHFIKMPATHYNYVWWAGTFFL